MKRQCEVPWFRNKAAQHPVRAREVQTQHQIDLIDMTQWEVEYKDVKYKYVLSLLDVFSRHVWLKPLQRKSSAIIAKELLSIYLEHGSPKVLQHDRGTEFGGAVNI